MKQIDKTQNTNHKTLLPNWSSPSSQQFYIHQNRKVLCRLVLSISLVEWGDVMMLTMITYITPLYETSTVISVGTYKEWGTDSTDCIYNMLVKLYTLQQQFHTRVWQCSTKYCALFNNTVHKFPRGVGIIITPYD